MRCEQEKIEKFCEGVKKWNYFKRFEMGEREREREKIVLNFESRNVSTNSKLKNRNEKRHF